MTTMTTTPDETWIDTVTRHADIFMTSCSGYWLYGVARDDERGWLAYDQVAGGAASKGRVLKALAAWKTGAQLPKHFYRLDRDAAVRAQEAIVCEFGQRAWNRGVDSPTEDFGIQVALLGEVLYG